MNKDELITEQALELSILKRRVKELEIEESFHLDRWRSVTKALDLAESASEQTVTDRIKYWDFLVS